jgi:hypothetical protein
MEGFCVSLGSRAQGVGARCQKPKLRWGQLAGGFGAQAPGWGPAPAPGQPGQLAKLVAPTPPPGEQAPNRNLLENVPSGNCQFDPCVQLGTCAVQTNNVGGGGIKGVNGVRRCGATSSSTVGWGGEPDRVVDKNSDTD